MAGRILNRRELRQQSDQAEATQEAEDVTVGDDDAEEAPAKKARAKSKTPKAPKVAKARKPRKAKVPPRQRARWGVFDAGMKQVAIFDYNQRAAADEKLADLLSKKKGIHFVQIVKEMMPEPEIAEVAAAH